MKKKTLSRSLLLATAAALLLTACGAGAATSFDGEKDFYAEEVMPAPAADAPSRGMDASAGGTFEEAALVNAPITGQAVERLVIENASLTLVVDSPEQYMRQIAAMADRVGGFVVSSSIYKTDYSDAYMQVPGAYITIRVPSELFEATLDEIRGGAIEVRSDNQTGQDVTAEYTDLQSRLRNLRDAEAMLREIMEEATDTEDVLAAFNQLNYITEQIEVLVGQIQYYEDAAALSAISIELVANESVQPIQVGPWDITGSAKEAIQALVKALQGVAEALVWFFLYLVPVVLVIGVPLLLIGWGVRKWAIARNAPKPRRKK